jgi:ribosomal-protein-alanine N-acetyltransferase
MDYFYQETERLTLRKLTEADICIWAEFFVDNPNARFIGLDLKKDNHELATIWLDRQFERYNTNQFGQLAAIEKATGNFVGLGGILTRELGQPTQPSRFRIPCFPTYWGKGYATELAMHMKRFGLENGVSDKFISIIHRENILSMNVALEKRHEKASRVIISRNGGLHFRRLKKKCRLVCFNRFLAHGQKLFETVHLIKCYPLYDYNEKLLLLVLASNSLYWSLLRASHVD